MYKLPPGYKIVDVSDTVAVAAYAGLHIGKHKLIILLEDYSHHDKADRAVMRTHLYLHEIGHAWANHLGVDSDKNLNHGISECYSILNALELLSFEDQVEYYDQRLKNYSRNARRPYKRALRHLKSFLALEGIQGPQKITKRHFRRLAAFLEAIGEKPKYHV